MFLNKRRKGKPKFQLINSTCRRCGEPIVTSNRSLFGADAKHAKFAGICCLTPDELKEMRGL